MFTRSVECVRKFPFLRFELFHVSCPSLEQKRRRNLSQEQCVFEIPYFLRCRASSFCGGCDSFNKDVDVIAHHGNVKEKRFGVAYMKDFDLVFNALDNIGKRSKCDTVSLPAFFPSIILSVFL